MKKKERKFKFIGNSNQYMWSVKPVHGGVYTESELKRMYGSGWSEEIFEYLLDPDEEDSSRDFEEVFGKGQRQVNDKEPTHFTVTVWWKDDTEASIEYPIDMYEKLVEDAGEVLEDKSHMLFETDSGHVLIPYRKLKRSTITFEKLWRE